MPFSEDRLDLPLDALIAETKSLRRQPRGHTGHFPIRRRGGCTPRRPMNHHAFRTAPYHAPPPIMVGHSQPGPGRRGEVPLGWSSSGINTEGTTKLYISNLDYDVTHRDIELLFSAVGELVRHAIHYDKSGRSKGTAEVVYKHHSDALAAMEKYNNHRLDGKTIEIKLVGQEVVATVPVFLPSHTNFLQEQPSHVFPRLGGTESRGLFHGRARGRGRGLVRYGGQKVTTEFQHWNNVTTESQQRKKVTYDDLDADLEEYRLKGGQKNRNQS